MSDKIPVTVLTGYLGAGKTTLLNRILSEPHGRKYAVIVNEFGEIGIDNDLIIGADEEVFEMNNGCVCCTVRGDLVRILDGLMKRKGKFDAIAGCEIAECIVGRNHLAAVGWNLCDRRPHVAVESVELRGVTIGVGAK